MTIEKQLQVLGDETRLRMLLLLDREELQGRKRGSTGGRHDGSGRSCGRKVGRIGLRILFPKPK